MRREQERDEWLKTHENRCELCGNDPKSRGLSEDHDHRTGAHRGWLCHRCNRALPVWISPLWLVKAALYLLRANDPKRDDPRPAVYEHLLGDAIDYLDAVTGGSAALSDSGSSSGGGQ